VENTVEGDDQSTVRTPTLTTEEIPPVIPPVVPRVVPPVPGSTPVEPTVVDPGRAAAPVAETPRGEIEGAIRQQGPQELPRTGDGTSLQLTLLGALLVLTGVVLLGAGRKDAQVV
jgi:LPXTG-motif cell wall-anchored protein